MHIGYFGIIGLMILSPVPPEVFMPLAGVLVAQGKLNLIYVLLSSLLGYLISVLPWYFAGRYLGEAGLKKLAVRHGRWFRFSPRKLEKAKRWFRRHGDQAVLFSLLLPGFRNLIAVPAGMSGMSFASYLLYSTLGALLWLTLLVGAGYFLGDSYPLVQQYAGSASSAVLSIMVVVAIIWGVRYYIRQNQQ